MAQIAFYAPLKFPDHPTPSGDRQMARNILAALDATGLGKTTLISGLRVFDKAGDPGAQTDLMRSAEIEANWLIHHWQGQDLTLWVTYHNYYKAPDLLGPIVSQALGIPYAQVESTRALSRLGGPWHRFARAAHDAANAANVIFYFTEQDHFALHRDKPPGQTLVHLAPFLAQTSLPPAASPSENREMLAIAMMRPGDKLASYRIIAESLALLPPNQRRLTIIGDGPARSDVNTLLATLGPGIRFLGRKPQEDIATAFQNAALFLWPGVNEAFGMVYLEAQAAGLPVVAQNRPGVRDILVTGHYPDPDAGPAALAQRLTTLLSDPEARAAAGQAARAHIAKHHLMTSATDTLAHALAPLLNSAP